MSTTSLRDFLGTLHHNLNILKEREAAYGSFVAPVFLLNQIEHYERAIELTEQALSKDTSFDELQDELNHLNLDIHQRIEIEVKPAHKAFTGQNPYRGLEKFTEDNAEFFFGRGAAIEDLLAIIREQLDEETNRDNPDLIAVLGASGSGKSSLVRAGLIPALQAGQVDGSDTWPIRVMVPGPTPLNELAVQFKGLIERGVPSIRADLDTGPEALHLLIAEAMADQPDTAHFTLIIDQFEELFTLCDSDNERRAFIDGVLYAAGHHHSRCLVVLTMRADFYDRVGAYKNLAEAITRHQMLVSPMTPAELREAILLPAEAVGLEMEKNLALALVQDTADSPGMLPLLQHALLELFNHRNEDNVMTMAAYKEIHGVRGALAHRADSVLAGLTPEQQQLSRNIFIRLTSLGEGVVDTRRRVTRAELYPAGLEADQVDVVLKALSDKNARLVVLDKDTVEVTHEALIQQWKVLHDWLEEDREALRIHRRLTEAAAEWKTNQCDPSYLYRGALMAGAREWAVKHSNEMTETEQTFLQDSVAEQERLEIERRKRNQRIIIGLAVGLVLVTIGAVYGFVGQNQAQKSEQTAISERSIAEAASTLAIEKENLALTREAEAREAEDKAKKQARFARANELAALAQTVDDPTGSLNLILAREAVLTTLTEDGYPLLQTDAALRDAVFDAQQQPCWRMTIPWRERHAASVESVVFSPDGQTVASGSEDQTVRLWDVTTQQEIGRFIGHTGSVRAVAFSPDGQTIASGSEDQAVRLWDVATQQESGRFTGHTGSIHAVAFSPDGRTIASGSGRNVLGIEDYTVRLWDVVEQQEIGRLEGHTWDVVSVAFSPDGQTIASGSGDGTVRLWDVATQQEIGRFIGHTGAAWSVAFSPDGQTIVSGNGSYETASTDYTVRLWDVTTQQEIGRFEGHTGPVLAVAFSPDGQTIVSGSGESKDNTVRLWDVATQQEIGRLKGHGKAVYTVAFSPDGQTVASGSGDHTVRLWDVTTQQEIGYPTGHTASVESAVFSPDGQTIASGSWDHTIRLWDVATQQEIGRFEGHTAPINIVAFTPDGKTIASGSGRDTFEDNTVRLWDVATQQEIGRFEGHITPVYAIAFSPDGKTVASGGGDLMSNDYAIRLWEVTTQQELGRLEGHWDVVTSVAFSPDGQIIASGGWDPFVQLWNVVTQKEIGSLQGNGGTVAFSPDGQTIVGGGRGNTTIQLWDVTTQQEVGRLEGHTGWILSVAFSPDGQTIASSSGSDASSQTKDNTVRLWNVVEQQEIGRLEGHAAYVNTVSFSPDGKSVVSGSADQTLRLWDVAEQKKWGQLVGHTSSIYAVAFSPDGQTIASGSNDNTVRLWDMATQQEIGRLEGHTRVVYAVAFSPDGQTIASGGEDSNVRLWDVTTQQEIGRLDTGKVKSVAFSPDGQTLATDNLLWDVSTRQEIGRLEGSTGGAVAFSPDGQIIASGSAGYDARPSASDRIAELSVSENDTVQLWNMATQQEIGHLEGHGDWITSVAFSPDGQTVASGSWDNTVRLWDVATQQEIGRLEGHMGVVYAVAFSPNGQTIASGGLDNTVRLWDVATQQEIGRLEGTDSVASVAFSPDGQTIVSGSYDSTLQIWLTIEGILALSDQFIQRDPPIFIGDEREQFGFDQQPSLVH